MTGKVHQSFCISSEIFRASTEPPVEELGWATVQVTMTQT